MSTATPVRADVDRALYPGTASDRKLDAFVARFKTIVWDLDPATLEILYDLSGDPTLSVAKLPACALERLAVSAREIFDRADSVLHNRVCDEWVGPCVRSRPPAGLSPIVRRPRAPTARLDSAGRRTPRSRSRP